MSKQQQPDDLAPRREAREIARGFKPDVWSEERRAAYRRKVARRDRVDVWLYRFQWMAAGAAVAIVVMWKSGG